MKMTSMIPRRTENTRWFIVGEYQDMYVIKTINQRYRLMYKSAYASKHQYVTDIPTCACTDDILACALIYGAL